VTSKITPQANAVASGRYLRGLTRHATKQRAMAPATPMLSGSRIVGATLTAGDWGLATARNSTRPPVQHRTPAPMTRSGRRRAKAALITTANSRSKTRIGCTRASGPKCRAMACIAEAEMSTVIPISQSRLTARSANSLRSSGGRFATLCVARCSMTSDAPNVAAPAIATSSFTADSFRVHHTSTGGKRNHRNRSLSSMPPGQDRRVPTRTRSDDAPEDSRRPGARPGMPLMARRPGAYPIDAPLPGPHHQHAFTGCLVRLRQVSPLDRAGTGCGPG